MIAKVIATNNSDFMAVSHRKKITHLYWRAGFGISKPELDKAEKQTLETIVNRMMSESGRVRDLESQMELVSRREIGMLTREQKKSLKKAGKQDIKRMNVDWLGRMAGEGLPFIERMTLFWHGHFARSVNNPVLAARLNNTIRKNALGKFRNLVLLVAMEPAMLKFLNNQQNKKAHPNENFARELMELFTIGRGNYSEQDIKEAARAFTGWGFNADWNYTFRQRQHDFGEKEFMGKKGEWNGDDIVDMILERKETAYYITRKICRYFVSDNPEKGKLEELATAFYDSSYDIGALMKSIFLSDWFYEEKHIGSKIKSPIELMAGLNKQFKVAYADSNGQIRMQRILGQTLFDPPNVAGWPGGRKWIDSSTLVMRMKLPSIVLNAGVIEMEPKEGAETQITLLSEKQVDRIQKQTGRRVKAIPDWEGFLGGAGNAGEMAVWLIQPNLSPPAKKLLEQLKTDDLKDYTLQLLSLPEYQMC